MHTTSIAKLTAPRLTQVHPRNRLFSRMEENRHRPVNWVCAPAGYGKTTLVSSYIHSKSISALWYQIDEGDADIASFFFYLGTAAAALWPANQPMPLLCVEHKAGDVVAFARHYFRELYRRMAPGTVMVLDNFQDACGDEFFSVIQAALQEIPYGINVVVVSRNEPRAKLASLRASHRFNMLDTADLQLLEDESVAIGRLLNPGMDEQTLKCLHQRTQGWVTGMILLLEQNANAIRDAREVSGVESLFHYFAEEIFHNTESARQTFLMQTAFLRKIYPQTAAALTGCRDAGDILASLSGKNYFTFHRGAGGYEYHPLFCEFLRNQAKSYYSAGHLNVIKQRAAQLLLDDGHVEDAVAVMLDTRQWQAAASAITAHANGLFEQGRSQTVVDWVDALPGDRVQQSAWLSYWSAMAGMVSSPVESRCLFERCYQQFEQNHDSHGMVAAWIGVVESIWYAQSDVAALDEWLDRFDALHCETPLPNTALEAKVVATMLLALIWRRPNHVTIDHWMERGETVWQAMPNCIARYQLGVRMAFYLGASGRRLANAKNFCLFSENPEPGNHSQAAMVVFGRLILAFIHCFNGQPETALQNAQAALQESDAKGLHVLDPLLLTVAIYVCLYLEDTKGADALLKRMQRLVSQSTANINTGYFYMLSAWRAAKAGRYAQADQNAQAALHIMRAQGAVFPQALCELVLAYVYFEQDQWPQAETLIGKVLQSATDSGFRWLSVMGHLFSAALAQRQKRHPVMLASLREGLSLARQCLYGQPLLMQKSLVAQLYNAALANDIEAEYVVGVIRQSALLPADGTAPLEYWPWPIQVSTFGHFHVLIGGEPINMSGKAQLKPMGLLKALIAFGANEVGQTKLTDQLWPDAEGDAARRAFNTTLHRLRKALGHDQALLLKDGKLSLNSKYCWVDVWAFDYLHHACMAALDDYGQDSDDAQVIETSRDLFRIYQGDFLQNDGDETWVLAQREKCHGRMVKCLRQLIAYYDRRGQWDDVLNVCEYGLEVDPVLEEFYQTAMNVHINAGRYAEVIAIYNRCKLNLRSRLGIMPSPVTEKFRQQVLGKNSIHVAEHGRRLA